MLQKSQNTANFEKMLQKVRTIKKLYESQKCKNFKMLQMFDNVAKY